MKHIASVDIAVNITNSGKEYRPTVQAWGRVVGQGGGVGGKGGWGISKINLL